MKKILSILGAIVLVIIIGGYLGRNFIVKKVLEYKLTELNKGKVDIGKVTFSPFDKRIVLENIDLTSRKDTLKNFVSIGRFEVDYDIYFSDKKILVSRADFKNIEFMTDRLIDGDTGYLLKDTDTIGVKIPEDLESAKDNTVQDIEELILARANINKTTLKNILEIQYENAQEVLEEKKIYWTKKIDELEKTRDYKILKENYEKLSKEKNPLKIIRMEKEIKNLMTSFGKISKELLKDREDLKNDFKNNFAIQDAENNLQTIVDELIGKGEFVITDLDSLVNYYLNEIYGERINELVEKYRTVMKEVELRRDEDIKAQDKWELFAEEINIDTTLYGIELKGEIKNISSRLSKNLENTELYLKADTSKSHGDLKGYINLENLQGSFILNIAKFDFSDIPELDALHKYVLSGNAGLRKEVLITRDNIDMSGDVQIHNMNINGKEVTQKLNIKSPLLKTMIVPLLKEVNTGNIHYGYNSLDGELKVKSDLSQKIMEALNNKDGYMKRKIAEDMMLEGKDELKEYEKILKENNNKTLKELEKVIDEKTKYLDKVQDILDKFNINGNNDFTNEILNKILN